MPMEDVKKAPSKTDQQLAERSLSLIKQVLKSRKKSAKSIEISVTGDEARIKIPGRALEHLQEILQSMADGKTVTLIDNEEELTTQEAADILNISRPYLVKLLESGEIPFTKVGKHRRVRFEDLKAYKKKRQRKRQRHLKELAKQAQKLDMGY
jgi:excisionase family DNA binding protein